MICPFCGHNDTRVIDSREAKEGKTIRRRRECDKCQARFSTYEEVEIMRRQQEGESKRYEVEPITDPEEIVQMQELVNQVYIDEIILQYVRDIIQKTRNDPQILMGAGPRASLVLMKCSKARAAILGRNYVTPDDIRDLCVPTLNHRLMLKPEAELEGINVVSIINRLLDETPCPL